MDIKELQETLKQVNEKIQNEFIDRIYNDVEFLCEKANKKSYEPTLHEKMTFDKIATIIENMRNWF